MERKNQILEEERRRVREEKKDFQHQWKELQQMKKQQEEWRIDLLKQQNNLASQGARSVPQQQQQEQPSSGFFSSIFGGKQKQDIPGPPPKPTRGKRKPPKTPMRSIQSAKTPRMPPPGATIAAPKTPFNVPRQWKEEDQDEHFKWNSSTPQTQRNTFTTIYYNLYFFTNRVFQQRINKVQHQQRPVRTV